MQPMWTASHRRLVAAAVIAGMIAFLALGPGGLRAHALADGTSERPRPSQVTDEDLFRAVVFGSGPAAEHVPTVKAFRDHLEGADGFDAERVAELEQEIITAVDSYRPDFLASFGRAMRSGNPVRVERTLDRAGDVLERVAEAHFGYDPSRTPSSSDYDGTCLTLVWALAYVTVAIGAGAVVIAAAIAVVGEVVADYELQGVVVDVAEAGSLPRDQLVAEITVGLDGR